MDHLDDARAFIVEAMGCLEQALVDGLPAQDPSSNREQMELSIATFRSEICEAQRLVAAAHDVMKILDV